MVFIGQSSLIPLRPHEEMDPTNYIDPNDAEDAFNAPLMSLHLRSFEAMLADKASTEKDLMEILQAKIQPIREALLNDKSLYAKISAIVEENPKDSPERIKAILIDAISADKSISASMSAIDQADSPEEKAMLASFQDTSAIYDKLSTLETLAGIPKDSSEVKVLTQSLLDGTAVHRTATIAQIYQLKKTHKHGESGDETSDGSKHEDFSAPFYTKVIFVGLAGAILYRLATFYVPEVEGGGLGDQYAETRKWVAIAQTEADDQLILRELGYSSIKFLII